MKTTIMAAAVQTRLSVIGTDFGVEITIDKKRRGKNQWRIVVNNSNWRAVPNCEALADLRKNLDRSKLFQRLTNEFSTLEFLGGFADFNASFYVGTPRMTPADFERDGALAVARKAGSELNGGAQ